MNCLYIIHYLHFIDTQSHYVAILLLPFLIFSSQLNSSAAAVAIADAAAAAAAAKKGGGGVGDGGYNGPTSGFDLETDNAMQVR